MGHHRPSRVSHSNCSSTSSLLGTTVFIAVLDPILSATNDRSHQSPRSGSSAHQKTARSPGTFRLGSTPGTHFVREVSPIGEAPRALGPGLFPRHRTTGNLLPPRGHSHAGRCHGSHGHWTTPQLPDVFPIFPDREHDRKDDCSNLRGSQGLTENLRGSQGMTERNRT
jgi:hypothetical protein